MHKHNGPSGCQTKEQRVDATEMLHLLQNNQVESDEFSDS